MAATLPLPALPDLPELGLKLGGADASTALREDVLRVDVHEEVGKLARATVLVRNWDDEAQEVTHSEEAALALGAPVEIQLGYNGELETVFAGVLVELRGSFLPSRQPVLELVCRCKGALLLGGRRTRVLEESTDGDAAAAIAAEAGLDAETEAGAEQPVVVQRAETDWEFLRARAEALGYALYVRGDALVFRPPAVGGEPALELEWNANVLELELVADLHGRPEAATASAWDPEAAAESEAEAAAGDTGVATGARPGLADDVGAAGLSNRDERLPRAGAVGPDELALLAGGRMLRAALGQGRGRGRVLGLPSLRIDSVVGIGRVGDRLGGSYYVSAVRHVFDTAGYATEFELGVPPALGPAPERERPQGLLVGVVEDLDDPSGWGRVRVRLPWLDPAADALWARLARPDAGADRGFYWIPEVGDEVVVGLLDGDLRYPVVLGSLWNGTAAPPESIDAQANDVRALVTRSGHRLTFDDADGAALVKVETAAGQTLVLDDGSELVSIEDKSGNTLTMDSGGIALEAASGDLSLKAASGTVAIEGLKLEAKASSTAKIEASGTLDVEASAVLGLKGALVNINA